MKGRTSLLLVGGVLIVAAVGFLAERQSNADAAQGGQPGKAPGKENAADLAAIQAATQGFLKAFKTGDAKALAAHWTENGEYHADDGTTFHGRAAIEKAYLELFGKNKTPTEAEVEVTSIRFPSRDTAIEEGHFKVRAGKEPATTSRYTVLHVREGGKWLMAVVREWPSAGVSLRDLEWLIGTWEARRGDTEVRTTYEWWGDKAFLRMTITLKQKDRTSTGFQMIGKDGATGQIRSWTFDPEGSFGEATWSRDGKKWLQDSAGVLADGKTMAATNILTPIDHDSFTFQSVQRTLDGEDVADIPPVRVTRVKSK
jgi:uncharacterized protein (TIGR02246 family)